MVRHAPTTATRSSAFPVDEPLDSRGHAAARSLADAIPSGAELLTSPALRCRQTAAASGHEFSPEPLLAECDFGCWAGLTLGELEARDPGAVRSWILEPDAAPHGGEPLSGFVARVAGWLDVQARAEGAALAVTHAGVVRAALVRALDAPVASFWRLDVAPLSLTELHAHDGRWTVTRVNDRLAAAG